MKLHEIELPAILAACEQAGTDLDLSIDVNCLWTLSEVRKKAEELKEVGLKWLEEPIWPPENYSGLAELRQACAIAAGENASTPAEYARQLEVKSVDFVQPSVAKMGGISELCNISPLAALHNVTVIPHSFYDGPGLLAAIHATAALGTADAMIEWHYFDLEAQLYGASLTTCNGRISVPQGAV